MMTPTPVTNQKPTTPIPTRIKVLKKFIPLLQKPKRLKLLVGSRGSTKSTFVADHVAACVSNGQLWCCGREYQNTIDESVHRLLSDEIDRLGLDGFEFTNTEIRHDSGGRTFYKGLSRNILSLKGILSGIDGLWIEEGEGLTEATLRVLTASVRLTAKDYDLAKQHGIAIDQIKKPEIWITMNRGSRNDPITKKYLARAERDLERRGYYEDDAIIVISSTHRDVPRPWFIASGLEDERLDDFKTMNRHQYNNKWGDGYLEEVEDAIILEEWVEACIDAHIKLGFEPRGAEIVIHDPADCGDAKGLIHRHGSVIVEAIQNFEGDVNTACDWSTDYANDIKADEYIWDADGIGLSLKRQIGDAFKGKQIQLTEFNGSNTVDLPNKIYQNITNEKSKPKTNKETFKNRRAQRYWQLRDRIYLTYKAVTEGEYHDPDTLISFSSKCKDLRQLMTELCRIPRKRNGQGLIQIMSKQEMKNNGIPSPNLADPAMMSLDAGRFQTQSIKPIPEVGWGG